MFGRRSSGAGHAFNWYISSDKNSIKFFEPQSGKESGECFSFHEQKLLNSKKLIWLTSVEILFSGKNR